MKKMRWTAMAMAAAMVLSSGAAIPAMAEEAVGGNEEVLTSEPHKIRTIITTDGEIDDQCSLVRYMLYANMFELEGLVSSSSKFHYTTKEGEVFKGKTENQKWIDAYAQVYENLCKHADGFPDPEYLTSINVEGNVTAPGEMGTDTPGSLLIKKCIMDEREDMLFLQVWGGANTIAAALRSIEEEYKGTDQWEEVYKKVCDKIVLWNDLDQDNTVNDYILPHWPDVKVIMSYDQFWAIGYPWSSTTPEVYHKYYDEEFMTKYIANDANSLSQIYYNNLTSMGGEGEHPIRFLSEGDTPNFFYILDNGLRSWENPSYGGWAGRFNKVNCADDAWNIGSEERDPMATSGQMLSGYWNEASDDGDRYKPIWRWADDFQNEFAARMKWCTEEYENANHEPVVQVEEGIDLTAKRGETVTLTAKTYDPDGDQVSVAFWQYGDADTYGGDVELTAGEGDQVSFTVPEDAKTGDTIHIIVEAQDDDEETPITRYQRVIVTVGAETEQ